MKKCIYTIAFVLSGTLATAGTPTIDGTLDAAAGYVALGTVNAPGDNEGFGGNIDASAIYFTEDATNLYFFVQGRVDTSNDNGIMLLINTSAETGVAAGATGVGVAGSGGHAFNGQPDPPGPNINADFIFDFEVDHGFIGNPGGGSTSFFIDRVSLPGGRTTGFEGTADQSGTPLSGTLATHAFNNAGNSGGLGSSTGWEISIPRSNLGNVGIGATVEAFATVVSSTAFFSSDSAPTIAPSGNPGFNVDYTGLAGTFHGSTTTTLPVELDVFSLD